MSPSGSARPKVMMAMSGGVDSSVAAALLQADGYEVVGVTMKLWGGPSDTGCCSVSDVDDARRAADALGIEHHVFNFGDDFDRDVVAPYVADHAAGRTPNPCIECNRHLKFDRLLSRADALGFDLIATGHHARIVETETGPRLARGADSAKDQSYVLHVVTPDVLRRVIFPVGHMTKPEVRTEAARLGLVTASKPDSQDVCFITASAGRRVFLGDRIPLHKATVVDRDGTSVGEVEAVELVTVGQRKGLGLAGGTDPRYVVDVDVAERRVTVGPRAELDAAITPLESWAWSATAFSGPVLVQASAHGEPAEAIIEAPTAGHPAGRVLWAEPRRRIATGQSVVAYADDLVVGGGIAGAVPSR